MMCTPAPAKSTADRDLMASLKRMLEISCDLNSTADLETLLSIIMDAATELTNAEEASVLLLNPHTRDLYFAATSHRSGPDLVGMTVPLEGSIAGSILRTETPRIVSDVRQEPKHHKPIDEKIDYETRSLLGVPMLAENHRVGVLEAINRKDGEFNQDDIETLNTLANLAAIAIHKAGLIAQLKDANAQLRELDRLKSDFISVASHELRTPLAIILGYVHLLREDVGSEELDVILKAALRLRSVMDGMVNLQYIDAGESMLDPARFGLPALVQEVVDEQNKLIAAQHQELMVQLPRESCQVVADRESIRLVLTNLVSNAIKFTPAGGRIRITVTFHGDETWVSVCDSGLGIPAPSQKRLFTRFYQVEPHLTRVHGGMGLGLAVAKELLGLQHGRIWLDSTEGEGSTFTFALPLAKDADA